MTKTTAWNVVRKKPHAAWSPATGWRLTLCGNVFIRRGAESCDAAGSFTRTQWDEHNNGCDQCTHGQQRIDKELLKDQQACFTISITPRNPSLEIRSAFNQAFLPVFTRSRRQIVALQPAISCFGGCLQGTVSLWSAGSADETQTCRPSCIKSRPLSWYMQMWGKT